MVLLPMRQFMWMKEGSLRGTAEILIVARKILEEEKEVLKPKRCPLGPKSTTATLAPKVAVVDFPRFQRRSPARSHPTVPIRAKIHNSHLSAQGKDPVRGPTSTVC